MSPDVCIELESAILEDKNGKRFKMPNISESNHAIYFDDCDNFVYKSKKFVFKYEPMLIFGMFLTDEQKIARKLNLFKKLKFKQKNN